MKVRDLIQMLENLAAGENPDVILYNRATDETLRVDPDADLFDYEVLGGRDEIAIEFG